MKPYQFTINWNDQNGTQGSFGFACEAIDLDVAIAKLAEHLIAVCGATRFESMTATPVEAPAP